MISLKNYLSLLVLVLAILLHAVKCYDTSFRDVTDVVPKDCFVKLFFDDTRHTINLHEVRIPYTLQLYKKNIYWKLNRTIQYKFFPSENFIGSRTKKLANIVKLNYKNYVKLGVSRQDYFEILYFVNGPRFGRLHERTILLGNEEQYEMVSRNIGLYEMAFGISNHGNIVFIFPLLKLSSLWTTCGVRHYPFPEFAWSHIH
jgi:hypothetical protein